jgi:hypothetical protein
MRHTIPASTNICLGIKQRLQTIERLQEATQQILATACECAGVTAQATLVEIGENTLIVEVPDGDPS